MRERLFMLRVRPLGGGGKEKPESEVAGETAAEDAELSTVEGARRPVPWMPGVSMCKPAGGPFLRVAEAAFAGRGGGCKRPCMGSFGRHALRGIRIKKCG